MSKYCSKCGNMVNENDNFCIYCRNNLNNTNASYNQSSNINNNSFVNPNINSNNINNNVKKETNGMAVAGFVTSLVSIICCCGSFSTFSLVFSIIGLVNSKKVNGNGKGLAIAGIVISVLAYILLFIIGFGFGLLGEMIDSVENTSINPGVYY